MKHFIFLIIMSLFSLSTSAKSSVEVELEILTTDLIGEVVLDKETLFDYLNLLKVDIEALLKKEKGNKDLAILITIHSDKNATISMGARPALLASSYTKLTKALTTHPSPRTKFNVYSLMFRVKINDGCGCEEDFTPTLVFPYARARAEFNTLALVDKKIEIQRWMKQDVLPLLAHYEVNVDTVYRGVLGLGSAIDNNAYLGINVKDLTDYNPNYWRASMEMSLGNQLIPFTKVCLLLADGRFDEANRLLYVINFFYDDKTIPAKFDQEINDKLQAYFDELGMEIQKGIALHDQEKYAEACDHYEKLLKVFPNSAWLNYEFYYSKTALSGELSPSNDNWERAQKTIYACDPMYPINAQAKSGKEAYLLFRRQEINGLFMTKEEIRADIINYADIALDLENYAFAGQIYWLIFAHLDEEDYGQRNILAHFLYCLDKLGDTANIENFEDDFQEEFKKIETERIELMEQSVFFKAFPNDK